MLNKKDINNKIAIANKIINGEYHNITSYNLEIDKNLPEVTFLIPFYKYKQYLLACVNSILSQTYKNFKILIVDDSEDIELYNELKSIFSINKKIKIIRNEKNIGATETMLKCLKLCDSEYAVKIDQDDFYIDDNFLEKAMNKLIEDDSISFVTFNTITYLADKNIFLCNTLDHYGKIDKIDYFKNMFKKYKKPTSSFPTVFKTKFLYPPTIGMLGDSNLYLNLLLYGNAYVYEDIIGVYRFHSQNLSNNLPEDTIRSALKEKYNIYIKSKKLYKKNLYSTYKFQFFNTFKFYVCANCKLINAINIAKWANKYGEINFFTVIYHFFIYKIYRFLIKIYQTLKN